MSLRRFVAYFSLLIFSLGSSASISKVASNHTGSLGVAFVHGTSDHRKDADGIYWKKEFVDPLSEVLLPEHHFIVACDFTQKLWHPDAAGCAAKQLVKFINDKKISNLVVYTHSHGANMIRWILSNPSYNSDYLLVSKTIRQVIAIAPSSGGTALADEVSSGNIFKAAIGWLLGYHIDSVKQQRIGDMALLNGELLLGTPGRPSLPVLFRSIVGTDIGPISFSSAIYCNGYLLNLALKFTQLYLNKCSDGFLDCSSQSLAGQVWFLDREKTTNQNPLSHNQSRHSCFSLESILREDLISTRQNYEART